MNRRIAVITSVSLGLSLIVAALLWPDHGFSKITVSFVNVETSYAAGHPFWNVECKRLALDIRNEGRTSMQFEVSDIKDEHGEWFQSSRFPCFQSRDVTEAGKVAHLYFYVAKDSHPQALRIRGYKKATTTKKAQVALRLLSEKVSGRYPAGQQVWFQKLSVPAYESIVNVNTNAEPVGLSQ